MQGKQVEWFEDKKTVKIRLPIKGTSIKKIEVEVSDLVLKVNVTEKNMVRVFDLKHEVEWQSKEQQSIYQNEVLEIQLIKKSEEIWGELTEAKLSKEELKVRRADSLKRKEEVVAAQLKEYESLKYSMC